MPARPGIVDPATPLTPVARARGHIELVAHQCVSVGELDAAVSMCRACPRLVQWREEVAVHRRASFADEIYWGRPVTGFGPAAAQLLVLGLAPAAHGGNRTGRVFTGDRSGEWLFAALHRAGLANQPTSVDAADGLKLINTRVAAAVRCAPPGNRPTPSEFTACAPWLRREIELLPDLRSVLALGQLAWAAACAVFANVGWIVPKPRPKFAHGTAVRLERTDGHFVTLVGSYHPSQQNTFTGRLTTQMLDAAIATAMAATS